LFAEQDGLAVHRQLDRSFDVVFIEDWPSEVAKGDQLIAHREE
jgi:hypothetical protein